VVAKALCAYGNVEMNQGRPTLEALEVAREWRRQGIGAALLRCMEDFFAKGVFSQRYGLRMDASRVPDPPAARWLKTRGFRDDDGMCEEMSKRLRTEVEEENGLCSESEEGSGGDDSDEDDDGD